MNLPIIDIPVKLPFDVPLLVHPIFVHFAVAIPIIVLLIELINLKAKKPAVSVTSLFLLTLAVIVYAGAFFTGKADGSEAFSLLTPEAKEELKFHKLLGTYLVYGTPVLLLLKAGAMAIRRAWARNTFIVFLLIFIAVLLKQGKDGGELVYEYGVNVKPVMSLQDRLDDMEFDMEDLKEELQKAKAECADKNMAAPAAEEGNVTAPAPVIVPSSPAEPAAEPAVSEKPAEENASAVPSYRESEPVKMNNSSPVPIPTH
ncbi:ORF 73 ECLF1 [Hydrogenimonas sp.]|nr:ORF 73 ECLF1 [Hydrogenimonas sp.]